jgi:hypothetical protein
MTLQVERRPSKSEPVIKGGPCEIVTDIETIPSQIAAIRESVAKDITPPANWKDPEKIEAYIAREKEKQIAKLGLNGYSAHIICIGAKIDDSPAVTFHSESFEDERKIIIEYFDYISKNCGAYAHTWIGHNISGFDFKILRQRCMVHQIKWPVMFEKPFNDKWSEAVYDTMTRWTGDQREYISLDKLCLAFGIESPKSEMSGEDVYKYWQAGRIKEIAEYCKKDVEATYAVYRNMTMSL